MVTPVTTIFYPEADETPLPGGDYQLIHFVEILSILKLFFKPREDILASGNNFIYYVEGDPQTWVAPICFVLVGGNLDSIWRNDTYLMWEVGKAPDFVMEIGSPSTARQDLGPKRDLYASLGVGEYWMFDPSGGDHYGEPLVGETLVEGEYRELEMFRDADGGVWGYSPTLNLELHWQEGRLRFYDPVGDRWLENIKETDAARKTAEASAEIERAAREPPKPATPNSKPNSDACAPNKPEKSPSPRGEGSQG